METIAGITIPDSDVARAATEFCRGAYDEDLFNHCRRVYLLGMLKARHQRLDVDPDLAYVGALFHDLGLTPAHRRTDQRFELDGADAAREFLLDHGVDARQARKVWLAIALHTAPEVPVHMEPEVAVVTLGVEADVLGFDLDQIGVEDREAVVRAHPRTDFKNRVLEAFHAGMKDRPGTTFGTMNDDVLAHFDPTFERQDFVRIIQGNDWEE